DPSPLTPAALTPDPYPLTPVVKVLDMGLARDAHHGADEDSSTLARECAVLGTADYIAPQQALSSLTANIQADLYTLGCTAHFLLTGKVPFPGGSFSEKLLKHQMSQPVPVEERRPDVPSKVAAIVYKLMAKKPEERYQTPAELAAALQALAAPSATPAV